MKRCIALFFLCFIMFSLVGCSKSNTDKKEENLESLESSDSDNNNEVKSTSIIEEYISHDDLPEPFSFYTKSDNEEDMYTKVNDTIPVNSYDNCIGYITNIFKWIPEDCKLQFNGLIYKGVHEDIINGYKLAEFRDMYDEDDKEVFIDITNDSIDFNSKPYISVLTNKKDIGVISIYDVNEDDLEPGYRLILGGKICQFENKEEYENSYSS